jgi:hypothetical protein
VFITLLIVFEMFAYIVTTPRPQEQFYQLYVLGANRMAADYYPNGDPNIPLGVAVDWYLGVTNDMGSVQLVEVRVKLGNQTIQPPGEQAGLPSPAPLITSFHKFMLDNATWEFPFIWQISNATAAGGITRILVLQVNNQTIPILNSSAQNGYNFRFIIELWSWNVDSSSFQFGWYSGSEHQIAWLQVWFNATTAQ